MNSNEAKLLLESYTLGAPPTDDPRAAQALALAASDPQLRAWWEARQAEDRALQRRLHAAPVPDDLRAALAESAQFQRRKQARASRLMSLLALAACAVLAMYFYFQYGIDRSDDYAGPLPSMAYAYSVDGPRLTYFDSDAMKLRDWLADNGFALPEQLPPKLLEQEGIGCRPLDWSPGRVALMCFDAEVVYHLFIGYKRDFPAFAAEEIEIRQGSDGWTVSEWQDGKHVFVLTAKTPEPNVRRMLALK